MADEQHDSYVVSMWPLMGIVIDHHPAHADVARHRIYDLAKDDTLSVANLDRITVGETPAFGTAVVNIRIPEDRL